MKQQPEKICPTCIGTGSEVRRITHPLQNVYGWHRVSYDSDTYSRFCNRCNGTGFVPVARSVPIIPRPETGGALNAKQD